MSRLRIYGVARTRAFRAIWIAKDHDRPAARATLKLRTEADAATPAEATRMIARINRL
jgi:hypothetical protein